jgi:hypothetical protein
VRFAPLTGSVIKTNNGLKVIGSAIKKLSFAQPDENGLFQLVAGARNVQIVATSGKEKSVYDVDRYDQSNPVTIYG